MTYTSTKKLVVAPLSVMLKCILSLHCGSDSVLESITNAWHGEELIFNFSHAI